MRKLIRGKQERIEFCKLQNIGFEKYYYDVTGFKEKDKIILEQFLAHMQKKELVKIGIEPKIFSEAAEQRDFIEKRIMCPYESGIFLISYLRVIFLFTGKVKGK